MDIDTNMPAMLSVVDIQFKSGGKSYTFDPGELTLSAGQEVIIDTQQGLEYGVCQRGNYTLPSTQVVQPLRPVVRLADNADLQRLADNAVREAQAFDTCQQFIERLALDMKLVRVEAAFDGSKLLFFFTSDGRVDFRELVKNLASVYHTRIEMRQIGVRDEAKLLGGLGICGRPFCCSQFLDDFQPVSIKMAKTQSLSLNPTKISGTCGRLMCCLKYEQDAYEDLLKTCPHQGSLVDTVDGRGTVVDTSLLRQQVKVSLEDSPDTVRYYRTEDIAVLRDGKAKKTDPPIPKDVAPISGNPERRAQLQNAANAAPQSERFSALSDSWTAVDDIPLPDEPSEGAEAAPQGAPSGRSRRRKPAAHTDRHPSEQRDDAPSERSRNAERSRSEGEQSNRSRTQGRGQNPAAPTAESGASDADAAAQSPEAEKKGAPNRHRRPYRGKRGGRGRSGPKPPRPDTSNG